MQEIERGGGGPAFVRVVMRYTLLVGSEPEATIRLAEEISEGAKAMAMTAAEKLMRQGEQEVLLRQLARRFGALPAEVTSRVQQATPDQLIRWTDRILDAPTLDEVLAD